MVLGVWLRHCGRRGGGGQPLAARVDLQEPLPRGRQHPPRLRPRRHQELVAGLLRSGSALHREVAVRDKDVQEIRGD